MLLFPESEMSGYKGIGSEYPFVGGSDIYWRIFEGFISFWVCLFF